MPLTQQQERRGSLDSCATGDTRASGRYPGGRSSSRRLHAGLSTGGDRRPIAVAASSTVPSPAATISPNTTLSSPSTSLPLSSRLTDGTLSPMIVFRRAGAIINGKAPSRMSAAGCGSPGKSGQDWKPPDPPTRCTAPCELAPRRQTRREGGPVATVIGAG